MCLKGWAGKVYFQPFTYEGIQNTVIFEETGGDLDIAVRVCIKTLNFLCIIRKDANNILNLLKTFK